MHKKCILVQPEAYISPKPQEQPGHLSTLPAYA